MATVVPELHYDTTNATSGSVWVNSPPFRAVELGVKAYAVKREVRRIIPPPTQS